MDGSHQLLFNGPLFSGRRQHVGNDSFGIRFCTFILFAFSGRLLAADSVDFQTEIVPILTKSGCNAGACHGAAAGRGGFKLSLLGSNPEGDYHSIVHEYEGRRTNLAKPLRSLIIAKPSGKLDHGGDLVLEEGSRNYHQILKWIDAGTPRGLSQSLTDLQITTLKRTDSPHVASFSLKVAASFTPQPSTLNPHLIHVDVTQRTTFTSSDPSSVVISESDSEVIAIVKRRGQHSIVARYLNRVVPLQFNIPFDAPEVDLVSESRINFIDDEICRVLSELRIPKSRPATGTEWIRRVTLDLTGRLPSMEDTELFRVQDTSEARTRWIEELLASEAFNDYWTLNFSKLLRMHSLPNDTECVKTYADWLRKELANGTGFDKIASQLLTAVGDSHWIGPSNFSRMVGDAREHAERVGQVFMGVQIGCANCHNHPLDRWTQDDYHGLAAIFAKIDRGREVRVSSRGAVTNLRTNEPAIPRLPGDTDLAIDGDHRERLAQWLTDSQNKYFAKATVNRLWKSMFGRGLVEPVDDLRETNLPTHPALLDRLATDFIANEFNIRHTLKLIALSQTYATSSDANVNNALDDRFYSHAYPRPLAPEVILDAIADVMDVPNQFRGRADSVRAIHLVDPIEPEPSLEVLGRCSRVKSCETESPNGRGLSAQLHLMNGSLINSKIIDPKGRLHRMILDGLTNESIVNEFFARALCARPSHEVLQNWKSKLQESNPSLRVDKLEDFVWGLLNSRSFLENH
ncbi:MAG: DUF1553 domain-containing protein [Pirellula sp.]